jgi:hypothetical protein
MIWLISVFLIISLLLNILLAWYIKRAVKDLLFVSDNIGDFLGTLSEYLEHIENVYELEVFYGDETLKALLDHTGFIVDQIRNFESVYSLTRYEQEEEQEEEEGIDDSGQSEEAG